MKNDAIIINTARGELQDIEAIVKALEEEYAGKCYMWPAKNKDGLVEGTYEMYG